MAPSRITRYLLELFKFGEDMAKHRISSQVFIYTGVFQCIMGDSSSRLNAHTRAVDPSFMPQYSYTLGALWEKLTGHPPPLPPLIETSNTTLTGEESLRRLDQTTHPTPVFYHKRGELISEEEMVNGMEYNTFLGLARYDNEALDRFESREEPLGEQLRKSIESRPSDLEAHKQYLRQVILGEHEDGWVERSVRSMSKDKLSEKTIDTLSPPHERKPNVIDTLISYYERERYIVKALSGEFGSKKKAEQESILESLEKNEREVRQKKDLADWRTATHLRRRQEIEYLKKLRAWKQKKRGRPTSLPKRPQKHRGKTKNLVLNYEARPKLTWCVWNEIAFGGFNFVRNNADSVIKGLSKEDLIKNSTEDLAVTLGLGASTIRGWKSRSREDHQASDFSPRED